MSKTFIVKEIRPCWVTFSYRVQADDEEGAVEGFYESQADYIGEEVGDSIGWLDHTGLEVGEEKAA